MRSEHNVAYAPLSTFVGVCLALGVLSGCTPRHDEPPRSATEHLLAAAEASGGRVVNCRTDDVAPTVGTDDAICLRFATNERGSRALKEIADWLAAEHTKFVLLDSSCHRPSVHEHVKTEYCWAFYSLASASDFVVLESYESGGLELDELSIPFETAIVIRPTNVTVSEYRERRLLYEVGVDAFSAT